MARIIRTFSKAGLLFSSPRTLATAYSDDNGKTWKWASNDQFAPLDACEEYGIPCDPAAQQKARQRQIDKLLAEYRRTQPAQPTDEERFEALAAFGPNVTVVDVVSGRKYVTG